MKKLSLSALAVSAVLANGSAFALPTTQCGEGLFQAKTADFLVALGNYNHGAAGSENNGCIQQDKIFSNFAFSTTSNIGSYFSFTTLAGVDTHVITTPLTGITNGTVFTMTYSIDIIPSAVANGFHFKSISSGATYTNGDGVQDYTGTASDSAVYNITTNGGIKNVTGTPTWITVNHTVTAGASGTVQNVSDTYQEHVNGIPEIDALAGTGALTLLAGAVALAGERRRRKA